MLLSGTPIILNGGSGKTIEIREFSPETEGETVAPRGNCRKLIAL